MTVRLRRPDRIRAAQPGQHFCLARRSQAAQGIRTKAMHELYSILDAWEGLPDDAPAGVLATIVHVQGSSYRRPGARMLMFPDGRRIGSISGGCLEGDLVKKAWWLTRERGAALRVYDTTSEEEAIFEFGLGCNGIVHVLLERTDQDAAREALDFLNQCRRARLRSVAAVVIRAGADTDVHVGDRLLVSEQGMACGLLRGTRLEPELRREIETVFHEQRSRLVRFDDCEVFVEWVGLPIPLILFGAGHDAIPLAALAKQLGWHVTVADGRPGYARSDRFPGADQVLLAPHDDPMKGVEIGEESVVVLMTHNYAQDGRLLQRLLPLRPRYLGLLGPKVRAERLLRELGVTAPPELHAPVGLDLGAETPETIALSVVAEIQAELAGRSGERLRQRSGAIHGLAPMYESGSCGGVERRRLAGAA